MNNWWIKLCSICTLFFIVSINGYTQDTKMYVKLGVNWVHNLQTNQTTTRLMDSPEGFMPYESVNLLDSNPMNNNFIELGLPVVGAYIAFPFLITTGIEYQPETHRVVYKSTETTGSQGHYYIQEYTSFHSIAIPVFFDTRTHGDSFSFYAGGRFHFNLGGVQLQQSSWNETVLKRKLKFNSDEIDLFNFSLVSGINISVLNIEVAYYPTTSFNRNYINDAFEHVYEDLDRISTFKLSTSLIIGGRN